MRVLFLSFYFPPDLCAGSFRSDALVEALVQHLPEGSSVDVLTTLPNRYASYSSDALEFEENGMVCVRRVRLPAHQSGMVDQSRSFLAYARFVKKIVRDQNYDLVFASSSRLMTAVLGASISGSKNIPLYLDIRDIFVDTIKDVLPSKITWLLKPLFSGLERWTLKSASRLNVVSEGFIPYFEKGYPSLPKVVFTNGIDEEFIVNQPNATGDLVNPQALLKEDQLIEVVYAGNIGEGQGLHNILPKLTMRLKGRARFRVIGAGGRLTQLEKALQGVDCGNVVIEPPVNRQELIQAYLKADVLFLHLNDYDAFLKVLPSKLFEYGALGKPILAGVAGHAAGFVHQYLDNAEVFSPCNIEEAVSAFERLEIQTCARPEFVEKFSRSSIMNAMAKDIIATGKGEL